MATYTITETGSNTTNGLWLKDILNGTNASGQHPSSTQVAFGDTIKITSGITLKAPSGGFILPALGAGTGTDADYISVECTNIANFTSGVRTNPTADYNNYAHIINTGADPAITLTEGVSYSGGHGARYWKFRGLDITNDGTDICSFLVNLSISYASTRAIAYSVHHFKLEHCFLHPKEMLYTNLLMPNSTSMSKAVVFGSQYLWLNDCYIVGAGPFESYRYGTDLVINGTDNTKVTSPSYTFTSGDVGLQVTIFDGTNFTKSRRNVSSVTGGAAILSGAAGTTGSTGGTWALGAVGSGMGLLVNVGTGSVYVDNCHIQSNYNPLFFGGSDNYTANTGTISASSVNIGAGTGTATLSNTTNISVGTWVAFQTTSDATPNYTNWHSAKVTAKSGNDLTLSLKNGSENIWSTAPYVTGTARWVGDNITNVEVTGCYIYGMPDEHGTQAYYDNWDFYPKAWCEVKDGSNMLWEGNVFYSSMGTNLAFYPNNQSASQPWVKTSNNIVRNNIFYGSKDGPVAVLMNPNYAASQTLDRVNTDILISNNLAITGFQPYGASGYQVGGSPSGGTDVRWLNNTFITNNSVMYAYEQYPLTGSTFKDNIVTSLGPYGFNIVSGTWATVYGDWTITYNVLVDNNGIGLGNLGATNNVASNDIGDIGFTNVGIHDYRLSGSSGYLTFSSTGGQPGVNFTTVYAQISSGDWPFSWNPGVVNSLAIGLDF